MGFFSIHFSLKKQKSEKLDVIFRRWDMGSTEKKQTKKPKLNTMIFFVPSLSIS